MEKGKIEKLTVLQKIGKARNIILNQDIKKMGYNEYSNYHYLTPEQINMLVFKACEQVGLITLFELVRQEIGYVGVLRVVNVDDGEYIEFTMPTDVPEIRGTNTAQQLGGCVTYTQRYLLMTVFSITDNSLDYDSKPATNTTDPKQADKPFLNKEKIALYAEKIRKGEYGFGEEAADKFINRLGEHFKLTSNVISTLKKEFISNQ